MFTSYIIILYIDNVCYAWLWYSLYSSVCVWYASYTTANTVGNNNTNINTTYMIKNITFHCEQWYASIIQSGKFAVVNNTINVNKLVSNNLNGYLVNNREEWIRILTKLCDDIDLRNYVGKNGRKHIEKFYSVDAISKKYLNVINNL